jgi:hypothetical protein
MNTTVSSVYILRSYAWQLLKNNYGEIWDESNYGGMVPIVPLGEEPELNAFDGPHIVYGYAMSPTNDNYHRKTGSVTFAIYDDNFRQLTKTMNILQTAFERLDETARDINEYSDTIEGFIGISFKYVGIAFAEGGTPEDEEGGRQSALINIYFEYTVEYNVKTSISEWTP